MSGASLGSGPQSREYPAKETGEVSQGCQAAGGLLSGSCHSLLGLQVGQELVASGGSTGSGPQPKGDSADEMGEVCQGSRELPSVTHWGFGAMQGGQELGASGAPQGLVPIPWETPWKRQGVRGLPGACLDSASCWCLWQLQGSPRGSQGSATQLREDPEEETLEVCQGPGVPAGLPSASCLSIPLVQGWQELVASGGSSGLGPQFRGALIKETREVFQRPGRLDSASCWCLWQLRGSPRGSQGSAHQLMGDFAEDTREVCQGPLVPVGLASASHRRHGGVQGGEELMATGEPREYPGPTPGRLSAPADVSCVGWAQGPTSLGMAGE